MPQDIHACMLLLFVKQTYIDDCSDRTEGKQHYSPPSIYKRHSDALFKICCVPSHKYVIDVRMRYGLGENKSSMTEV